MAAKQQKVTIKFPSEFKFSQPEQVAIGREIVKFIRERTEKGLDKDNNRFPGYSTAYKKSLDFKNAGKSSRVNLRLTGDMMSSIKLLEFEKKNQITIGLDKGDEDNGKMEGNRLGTYGTDTPKPKKARDPLGIDPDDLLKILRKFKKQPEALTEVIEETRDEITGAIDAGSRRRQRGETLPDISTTIGLRKLRQIERDLSERIDDGE